jgi:Asp-tRNA(Asn)/Glu-tRNA(Gln) amidotransferase A subunit family amidase
MRESALAAVEQLGRAGAVVDDIRMDLDFNATFQAHRAIQLTEMAWWHRREGLVDRMDLYQRGTRDYIERGLAVRAVDYYDAIQVRRLARERMTARLDEVDILVSPTTSAPAPPLREQSTGQPAWQSPWSLTGFPSITLPIGLTADGLPTGIQLGAAPWQEARLLNIAAWVEKTLDARLPPPAI